MNYKLIDHGAKPNANIVLHAREMRSRAKKHPEPHPQAISGNAFRIKGGLKMEDYVGLSRESAHGQTDAQTHRTNDIISSANVGDNKPMYLRDGVKNG